MIKDKKVALFGLLQREQTARRFHLLIGVEDSQKCGEDDESKRGEQGRNNSVILTALKRKKEKREMNLKGKGKKILHIFTYTLTSQYKRKKSIQHKKK